MTVPHQIPFDFSTYKMAWNSGVSEVDNKEISELLQYNPLLNETLMIQGSALAVKDVRTMQYPLILGDVEKVCGWPKQLFFDEGVEVYLAKMPYSDQMGVVQITKLIDEFVLQLSPEQLTKFRAVFDYRIVRSDGRVARVCQESIVLKTDQGGHIHFLLALVTDISYMKYTDKQHLHLNNGTVHILYEVDTTTHECRQVELLSKREIEIAHLLSQNRTSEYIAEHLFISLHTVNTHRQNMIQKFGLGSTTELLNFLKVFRLL